MHQYAKFTNKVGMTILNLKVKDLNRFIEFKEIYALNSSSIPILGVNNIVRCKIRCIGPTASLYLEGMCFGTLDDLAINVKLDKTVNLIYGCGNNSFFSRFTSDMVNARNGIANLSDINCLNCTTKAIICQ